MMLGRLRRQIHQRVGTVEDRDQEASDPFAPSFEEERLCGIGRSHLDEQQHASIILPQRLLSCGYAVTAGDAHTTAFQRRGAVSDDGA